MSKGGREGRRLRQARRKRLERGGGSLIIYSLSSTADVRCHQSLEAAAC